MQHRCFMVFEICQVFIVLKAAIPTEEPEFTDGPIA